MIFNRIREIRNRLGFSKQEDFAKEIDVAPRTYQTYEQGQVKSIPHTFIEKLNKQYNVSFQWLLTGDGEMFNQKNEKEEDTLFENELINDIKKLSTKKQEYYFHRVRADLIEEEINEQSLEKVK